MNAMIYDGLIAEAVVEVEAEVVEETTDDGQPVGREGDTVGDGPTEDQYSPQ
jgi:hypothetical protein